MFAKFNCYLFKFKAGTGWNKRGFTKKQKPYTQGKAYLIVKGRLKPPV